MDSRAHILVVEDDAQARGAVEAMLRAAVLHVHSAGSGEEALALLESIAPDAVLLHLGLPGSAEVTVPPLRSRGQDVLLLARQEAAVQPDTLRLADRERETILAALARSDGSRAAASRELGVSRSTLYRKLKEYGLE